MIKLDEKEQSLIQEPIDEEPLAGQISFDELMEELRI